jgi:hypothetical protein
MWIPPPQLNKFITRPEKRVGCSSPACELFRIHLNREFDFLSFTFTFNTYIYTPKSTTANVNTSRSFTVNIEVCEQSAGMDSDY